MCVECIVVHKKPREGLNYARQAFDDWCCRRDHHDPPQRCPTKSGDDVAAPNLAELEVAKRNQASGWLSGTLPWLTR